MAISFSCSMSHLAISCLVLLLCGLRNVDAVSNATSNIGLGINCRGSSLCPSDYLAPDYVGIMLNIANGLARCNPRSSFNCGPMNDTDFYEPGAHIVCLPQGRSFLGGICAFTQGNLGVSGREATAVSIGVTGIRIKQKLQQLSLHGCRICGSVPLGNSNDPNEAGILTVNYVSGSACPGLCPPSHYSADQLGETH